MKKYPVVLTVAGSDSCGGAGIQADLKTIEALGAYGASAITAVTAQNTLEVRAIHAIPNNIVRQQIEAVAEDLDIAAIKTGMLFNKEIVKIVVECIKKFNIKNVVVDPVMVATSGAKLIEDETIETIKEELFPLATVITPNLPETELLLNEKINSVQCMELAAKKLLDFSCKCAIVKGGHLEDNILTDVYCIDNQLNKITSEKIDTKNTHGTGCTFSAAIATYLAKGEQISEAIAKAHSYLYGAILSAKHNQIGHGHGSLHHSYLNAK